MKRAIKTGKTGCYASIICLVLLPVTSVLRSYGQNNLPLPGNGQPGEQETAVTTRNSAPLPGLNTAFPLRTTQSQGSASSYRKLPLNTNAAALRLEELRNLMFTQSPQQFEEGVNDYCEWLNDMADAHWRLAASFAKHESIKTKTDAEREAASKFGQLKRKAMLLKAEFLIRQKRYPEALTPLINIVVAEPTSATGEAAYSLLKEIGFVEDLRGISHTNTGSNDISQENAKPNLAQKAIPQIQTHSSGTKLTNNTIKQRSNGKPFEKLLRLKD